MEAVPATSGARRTVRLATALVAGQILLVAVIGWVTFTCAGKHPGGDPRGVDQLAAPPAVIPPAPAPTHSATPATSTSAGPGDRPRTADPDRPVAPRPAPSSAAPTNPAPAGTSGPSWGPAAPPAPPAVTTPVSDPTPPLTLLPTSDSPAVSASTPAPTPSSTPPPVLAGQPCTEIFALARAVDGRMVRCLPARDHHLVWKIV